MAKLPKIAHQRLEGASPAEQYSPALAHPDADLLTAFVERNLAASERSQVMSHLATCAECREVVALSMPTAGEDVMLVAQPPRGSWTQWKFLRFGAGAAMAAVLVGVLLFTRAEKRVETTQVAGSQPVTANVPAMAKSKEPDAVSPGSAAKGIGQNEQIAAKGTGVSPAKRSQRSTARDDRDADLTAYSGNASKFKDAGVVETKPAAAPIVTAQSRYGSAGGLIRDRQSDETVHSTTFARPQGSSAGVSQGMVAGSLASGSRPGMQPSSASVAVDSTERRAELKASAEGPARAPELAMQQKNAADAVSKYADEAVVKKTPSNPTSQQTVLNQSAMKLEASADLHPQLMDNGVDPTLPHQMWQVLGGRLQKAFGTIYGHSPWKDVAVRKGGKFRVVVASPTSVGSSVWVGGDGGAIYHSDDDGANWKQVKGDWTGDIVSLHFNSLQQGSLGTSTHETWRTEDGGVTWIKQP